MNSTAIIALANFIISIIAFWEKKWRDIAYSPLNPRARGNMASIKTGQHSSWHSITKLSNIFLTAEFIQFHINF